MADCPPWSQGLGQHINVAFVGGGRGKLNTTPMLILQLLLLQLLAPALRASFTVGGSPNRWCIRSDHRTVSVLFPMKLLVNPNISICMDVCYDEYGSDVAMHFVEAVKGYFFKKAISLRQSR